MKYLKPLIFGAFALNAVSFAVVGGFQISKNVNSTTATTARQAALSNIAKHVISDTCWQHPTDSKLKIGDPVILAGTETGKIPTSCMYAPQTKQFVEVAYENSELQVIRAFSIKEVQAAKSQILSENIKEK